MRLLYRDNDQLLFRTRAREPYAILSHTWGEREDETSYRDICDKNLSRPSCEKVKFCLEEAKRTHGLENVWIDSCCINRSDNNELGEAIQLMFKYYSEAQVCLVHLADISYAKRHELTSSRWFTRGWTIQEFVAARNVRFFSNDGQYLGDKSSLASSLLSKGFDVHKDVSQISILDRFKWSLSRQTSKEEDMSYCMIGLLEVQMSPSYGEGFDTARRRLIEAVKDEHGRRVSEPLQEAIIQWQLAKQRELDTVAASAALTASTLMDSLMCQTVESRRMDIEDPYARTCDWLLHHENHQGWMRRDNRLLWLKGNPGSGKSVLMKFAHTHSQQHGLKCIGHYFNARGDKNNRNAYGLYCSLLHQLLNGHPALQELVVHELTTSHNADKPWTIGQLQHALKTVVRSLSEPTQCFIDALDECDDDQVQALVDYVVDLTAVCSMLAVCFTSRHWPAISMRQSMIICLEEQPEHRVALSDYIHGKLNVGSLEPAQGELLKFQLLSRGNGIFLWTSLVVQLLNDELVSGRRFNVDAQLNHLPSDLHALFSAVIDRDDNFATFRLAIQLILVREEVITSQGYYYAMITLLTEVGIIDSTEYKQHMLQPTTTSQLQLFVSSSSRGLAQVTQGNTVELIHESVQDFFLEHRGIESLCSDVTVNPTSWMHDLLKKACQRALSIKQDACHNDFIIYATAELVYHAERAAEHISQADFVQRFQPSDLTAGDQTALRTLYRQLHVSAAGAAEMASRMDNKMYLFILEGASRLIRAAYEQGCVEPALTSLPYLVLAVARQNVSVLRCLLAYGDASEGQRTLALLEAISTTDYDLDIVRTLLDSGVSANAQSAEGWTGLMLCAARNMTELRSRRQSLIETQNWFMSRADHEPNEALSRILNTGDFHTSHLTIALMLLDRGADQDLFDATGRTALMLAAAYEHVGMLVLLLQKNANPDLQSPEDGDTALHEACRSEAGFDLVRTLLKYNAHPNLQNKEGTTPLMLAAQGFCPEPVLTLLLAHNADAGIFDNNGETALDLAIATSNHAAIEILLEAGGGAGGTTLSEQAAIFASMSYARPGADEEYDMTDNVTQGSSAPHLQNDDELYE